MERSISENECEKQNIKKLNQIKMERRAKNREKLMAMKRFSGFLKRPEILGKIHMFLDAIASQDSLSSVSQSVSQSVTNDCSKFPSI